MPPGIGEIAGLTQYENTHYAAPTGRHRSGLAKAQTLGEAPEELRKTELIELLRRIAAKVELYLRAEPLPLILVAHSEIEGHFRENCLMAASCAQTASRRTPDAMRPDELHRRAYQMIAAEVETARMAAVERLDGELGSGDGKATTRPDEIVKAARYSRVDTLFVSWQRASVGNL